MTDHHEAEKWWIGNQMFHNWDKTSAEEIDNISAFQISIFPCVLNDSDSV